MNKEQQINFGPCASEQSLVSFDYMLVYDVELHLFAIFKKCTGFWQQATKWYFRYGNLKRYNKQYKDTPMYYKYIYKN